MKRIRIKRCIDCIFLGTNHGPNDFLYNCQLGKFDISSRNTIKMDERCPIKENPVLIYGEE